MRKPRPTVLAAVLVLVYLLTEAICFTGLAALERRLRVRYSPIPETLTGEQKAKLDYFLERGKGERAAPDADLGWVILREANSAGMRDDREYEIKPPPGVMRVAAFGDSFTYGVDVELHETWEKMMTAADPSLEVLNYGAGGYGLDQAFLRYRRDGQTYNPHVVLIGYMTENIGRHVNTFRYFYADLPQTAIFTKPRFVVEDGRLLLLENPLRTVEDYRRFRDNDVEVLKELGTRDYHYQTGYSGGPLDFSPAVRLFKMTWMRFARQVFHGHYFKLDGMYRVDSEAYQVTKRLFDAFHGEAADNGCIPVIVIFPDPNAQRRSRDGKPRAHEPLLRHFREKGYRYIDVLDALKPYEPEYSIRELTRDLGHFSPIGSKIIAEHILARFREWNIRGEIHQ